MALLENRIPFQTPPRPLCEGWRSGGRGLHGAAGCEITSRGNWSLVDAGATGRRLQAASPPHQLSARRPRRPVRRHFRRALISFLFSCGPVHPGSPPHAAFAGGLNFHRFEIRIFFSHGKFSSPAPWRGRRREVGVNVEDIVTIVESVAEPEHLCGGCGVLEGDGRFNV